MGEVIIDGVVFAFDETGTKLVKKISNGSVRDTNSAVTTSAKDASSIESSKAPLRTSVNGQSFIRTKRGNLISAELLEKRKTQKENNTKMKRLAKMGRQIGDHERLRCVCNSHVSEFSKSIACQLPLILADPPARRLNKGCSAQLPAVRKASAHFSPKQVGLVHAFAR